MDKLKPYLITIAVILVALFLWQYIQPYVLNMLKPKEAGK